MNINFFTENPTTMSHAAYMPPTYYEKPKKHYGFFRFLWDVLLVFLTCGIWLIWIFVREMRKR